MLQELSEAIFSSSGFESKHHILVLSQVRLLREGIAAAIEGSRQLSVSGHCGDLLQALSAVRERNALTVVLDASFPDGVDAIREIRGVSPCTRVIVFGVAETEENVIAWAKAGAAGYIPTTVAVDEVAHFIESVIRGEQICSRAIASRLMQRVGAVSSLNDERPNARCATALTTRELEIVAMISAGLSNKEIARRLRIELSTTKTHVHNVLSKTGLQRRGQMAHWAHATDAAAQAISRTTRDRGLAGKAGT